MSFEAADGRLRSRLMIVLRIVPVGGRQIEALSAMTRAGALSAEAGSIASGAIAAAPPGGWRLRRGQVDLGAVGRARAEIARATVIGDRAAEELTSTPRNRILRPIRSALTDATRRVTEAVEGLHKAEAGLSALPSLFGADEPKRYIIAFGNLAELRGTGGFIGYMSVLEARGGRLAFLDGSGRPTEELPRLDARPIELPEWFRRSHGRYGSTRLWQNVNTTADFPTVGAAITSAAGPAVGGANGVIQIDPNGIAALLRLTGPVRVPLWPEEISSRNVAVVTQLGQYVRYPNDRDRRSDFIGSLVDTVFRRMLTSDVRFRIASVLDLGDATRAGHIQVYSDDADDQRAIERMGAAGAIRRAARATDVLGVVTENASANKADWFLRRTVEYAVTIDPVAQAASTDLVVTLENTAPSSGLPRYVIGPNIREVQAGGNRQIVMIVRTPTAERPRMELGRKPVAVHRRQEAELEAYHTGLNVASGAREYVHVTSDVQGAVRRTGGEHVYRLHVLRQPVAHPDRFVIDVKAAPGWAVEGRSRYAGELHWDLVVEVKLHRTLRGRIWDVVAARPIRIARALLSRLW